MIKNKVIAIDFDGTITLPSKYPVTGEPNLEVINKLNKLKSNNIFILWTCREGNELTEAINLCNKYNLQFDYINENIPGRNSRKVWADFYFDDKSINTLDSLL